MCISTRAIYRVQRDHWYAGPEARADIASRSLFLSQDYVIEWYLAPSAQNTQWYLALK